MSVKRRLLVLAAGSAFGVCAVAQGASAGAADSAVRSAVLSAVKVPVERELTIPVALKAQHLKTDDKAAFVMATILKPNGRKMDFKGTPFDVQANVGGSFSDAVVALLKKENGAWRVKAITVGATDAPDPCWHKEFKVSKSLFPAGLVTDDCPPRTPFVFADNRSARMNGGIGLRPSELQLELTEALARMDRLPERVDLDFADGTSRPRRAELEAVVATALAEARKSRAPTTKP